MTSTFDLIPLQFPATFTLGSETIEAASVYDIPEVVPLTWAPVRQREYRAGRALAHALAAREGIVLGELATASDRTPIWPDALVGSISHSRARVFVALGRASLYRCLGLDIEPFGSVTPDLFDLLFVAEERSAITQGLAPTLLFCCKEAVYKAVYPSSGQYFDFHDLRVTVEGDHFSAQPSGKKVLAAEPQICAGDGHIMAFAGHHVATFHVGGF